MSHIITNHEQLMKVNYLLGKINLDDFRKYHLEDLITYLLPKDSKGRTMIDYRFSKAEKAAEFIPAYDLINFDISKLIIWIESNYRAYYKDYKIDEPKLRKYLLLYCVLHEIEHSYQYLMGEGDIKAPSILVKDCYHELMSLLVKPEESKFNPIKSGVRNIRYFIYLRNEQNYILERNANIEAGSAIIRLTSLYSETLIEKVFVDIVKSYTKLGYQDDNMGCMYHTCKDLFLKNFYYDLEQSDIKDDDRIRYGLKISNEKRKQLLRH